MVVGLIVHTLVADTTSADGPQEPELLGKGVKTVESGGALNERLGCPFR